MFAQLLLVAGLVQTGIFFVALTMPAMLRMHEQLRAATPFVARLVHVHTAFITLTIAGFAAVTLFNAPALAAASTLSRSLCGFIAVFWAARLFVQLVLLREHPFRAHQMISVGFHGLTIAFAYLALVYGAVAVL